MTYRFSAVATARIIGIAIILSGALVLLGTRVLGAQATPTGRASSTKAASATLVNQIFGSDGARGHFSARLSPGAHVMAALMSMVSGVPYAKIAKGGSYTAKIASSGKAGMAVVTFSDHALGKACVQWSGTSGPYDPTKGHLPVNGSLKAVGGTGAAARWRGSLKFKQTGDTGSDTLQFSALVTASTGPKHGLTKACKAVTKLKG